MSNCAKAGSVILTINSGSSSLKFALYEAALPLSCRVSGGIERIGITGSAMSVTDRTLGRSERWSIDTPDHQRGADRLFAWIEQHVGLANILAVGHRIVHGGPRYSQPQLVTPDMLAELRQIEPYDPEHLPAEIALIEAIEMRNPALAQFACFDTAFHREMPRVARLIAIPRRFDTLGVQRYGFHGLSYAFLMKELARVGHSGEANGRVILAHLGNGASMAAVKNGKPVDTTMGFTPTSGLPMSRRSGDLDPGLVSYLARTQGINPEQFQRMVNTESGLLGISELSPDMRDLLAQETRDPRAAEAVAFFCYQARKWIGAFAAILGGLDTLVFSAGIGEYQPVVRTRICEGLAFLGLTLDEARNQSGDAVISEETSPVTVRVIHTDEEREIAQAVYGLLQETGGHL